MPSVENKILFIKMGVLEIQPPVCPSARKGAVDSRNGKHREIKLHAWGAILGSSLGLWPWRKKHREEEPDGNAERIRRWGFAFAPIVTAEEFANKLENGRQVSKPSNDKKGEVMINLDVIETILMDDEPQKDDKYVSEHDVEKAIVRVNSKETPGAKHSSKRKGTGFITKAAMMDILSKVDDEEEEDEVPEKAQAADGRRTSTSSRCKDRKGTGYVSKDKLQKILAAAGEEET
ncbi:unnamed protein product [Durusdinium trenchii]|uniref:Uncharacterized protein n=1 Tax=Durusdinium trenchii TaxID=1381693 RepID=A0ABP0NPJ2_9DINO